MRGLGPQTGAGDGGREFKAMTTTRGLQTGAHWKAEEKQKKQAARAQRRLERAAAKAARDAARGK